VSVAREPCELSAVDALARLRAGRLTATALMESCLARIAAREPEVHAWAHFDPQAASAQARALDTAGGDGLAHGLPFGVKDVIDTAGQPTAYGSPIYAGHQPAADAACVAMLRRAGALILGKTVTTEFATHRPGPTANPHDAAFTPGGSSSGSAAAVAACMVPLAAGTQTGGSIIRPAAYCGVVGFKPSFGTVARQGVKQVAESLDTIGGFGRNVADAALAIAALAGRPGLAAIEPATPARLLLCRSFDAAQAQPESVAALEEAAQRLGGAGITVLERELPDACRDLGAVHPRIEYYEVARALQHEYRCHGHLLSDTLRGRIEQGLATREATYLADLRNAIRCRHEVAGWIEPGDVVLTFATQGEAPRGLVSTGSAVFNRVWTLLGLPCLALPCARGPNGLPVGIQLVGAFGADARLAAHAAWVERTLAG